MGIRGLRSGVLAGALALVVAVGIVTPADAGQAPIARFDDYPSWDEVEAARGNAAATAATIDRLNEALGALQAQAAALGDAAIKRGAEADAATAALDRATAAAKDLAARSDAAAKRATKSAGQAAQIAAALYRSGGADLTGTLLLVSENSSTDLLYRLGALDKVGTSLQLALERAKTDDNQARALSEQAALAKSERDKLSVAAQAAVVAAKAAADAADAAVTSQQASLSQLYEQLASLKNTSVLLEQQYRIGQQASNDPGSSGGDIPPGANEYGFIVPGNEVNDVGAARAYAFAILAQNGYGPEQNDCLLWLWNRESNWRTNAYNPNGGAYGIPQSLPAVKMAAVGADWRTNYVTQVTWGIIYIMNRYGSPCGAWAHSEDVGWY